MILITGCAGYIGSRLAAALLRDGHEVVGIALPEEEYCLTFLIQQGLKVYYQDITNNDFLETISENIEVIYHLAGIHSSVVKMRRLYLDGTRNVLMLAKKRNCFCLIASNSAIYPDSNQLLTEDSIDFDAIPTVTHPFGKITYEMEQLCHSFYKIEQVPLVVLRIAQVYGDETEVLMNKLASGTYSLLGKGENYQSFIHIEDLIKIMKDFYRSLESGQAYNITDDKPVIQKEFYHQITKHFRVPMPVWIPEEDAGQRIMLSIHGLKALSVQMSNEKLKQRLKYKFLYPTFLDGLMIKT